MNLGELAAGVNKYLFILITLCFNVGGGYFAKLSATAVAAGSSDFLNYRFTALSILCYGSGFLSYVVALKYIPLFVAQSFLATQYVLMITLSYLVFNEQISAYQGIGMLLILSGLALVVGNS